MVNSGSFDSEGDRPAANDRCKAAGPSAEGAHSPSHPPPDDFGRPRPDTALPGLGDAVGPTPTKTEFNAGTASDSTAASVGALCCSLPLDKVQAAAAASSPKPDDGEPKTKQTSPPPRKLLCLYCERSFASPNLRQKHVERCHSSKQNRRTSSRRHQNQLTATPCIYCDRLTAVEHTLRELFEHLAVEHAQRYFACLPCEDRFLGASALAEHAASAHATATPPAPSPVQPVVTRNLSVLLEKDLAVVAAAPFKQESSSVPTSTRSSPVLNKCSDDKCAAETDLGDDALSRLNVKKERDDGSSPDRKKDAPAKAQPSDKPQKDSPDKHNRREQQPPVTKTTRSKVKASDQQQQQSGQEPPPPPPPAPTASQTDAKRKEHNARQLRSKKMTVKASKISQKRMSKRLQAKINEAQKKRRTRAGERNAAKSEQAGGGQKGAGGGEKASKTSPAAASVNPYPEFDSFYRVKKITDHSIDNLKITSLKFDDVFDKAFFNRIQCNIQENLLHHIDGKLFKNEESESRISNFEKVSGVAQEAPNPNAENYGCELSLNAVTPVASLLTSAHFGEDLESQIEYGSKPSKKKMGSLRQDEVHYKYFTRRKYQASIMEQKENRDLSKLDMWTQLVIKSRQQKMADDKKSAKEMLEYTSGLEYKTRIRREELNRILDRRGPFEDLKEEATKKAALDKLNSDPEDRVSEEAFEDVREILGELLAKVFDVVGTEASGSVQRCSGASQKCQGSVSVTNLYRSAISASCGSLAMGEDKSELSSYLKLRRSSSLTSEGEIDRSDRIALICSSQETEYDEVPSNSVRGKNEMVELTGEWARCRIYICAACGTKVANMKQLLEHKNVYHQYVWTQHYEFVGNQSELYRHLSIPGLGKVGVVEDSHRCKVWRRSDARMCTKCGRQCNALGDLHRHILDCGGDWTWMLARKKCKYRPFGAKSRRKRRGLVKRIRTQKNENGTDRKTYKKRCEGPRQRPSDADTIQRMLANLPAKRATRKIMSLKDGYQRNHQPHISIMPQNKMKCGKIIVRNTSNMRNNANAAGGTNNSTGGGRGKAAANPSGSSASQNQKVNYRNDRRTLKNLNKVLASRILDTNASLLVKRKLKTLSTRRVTRQDVSRSETAVAEPSRKESPKADDKTGKSAAKKTPPKANKAKADGADGGKEENKTKKSTKGDRSEKAPDVSDAASAKNSKVLPNKLNLKNFFPVKKKKSTAASDQKEPAAGKADDAASGGTSTEKKTNTDKTKASKDKNRGESDGAKKTKTQTFGSLVRSLSLRKRKLLRMEDVKTDKAEDASDKTTAEQEKTNKKRKLKQGIKNVVNNVKKKIKTAKASDTAKTKSDASRAPTGDNKKPTGPFLEAGNVEESPPIEKIVIPSTSEKSESTADISVLAPIVISASGANEEPQTSKTIFNLQSNNEKNLQAKGELDFDSQRDESTKVKNETDSACDKSVSESTPQNPMVSPMASPTTKGKIRRPAKRLNDCIAMLTNKLQQQQQQQNTTTGGVFNLTGPGSFGSRSQPDLFSAIPEPNQAQEECVALDLSMKSKHKEQEPEFFRVPVSSQCLSKSYSFNSIDRIIQEVVDNKFATTQPFLFSRELLKVPSKEDLMRKWNSVDDIIQRVIENKCDPKFDLPISKLPRACSSNCITDTINYVASGKDMEATKLRQASSDISLTISDIMKVPNVQHPNRPLSIAAIRQPTPIDISSLITGHINLQAAPQNLLLSLNESAKELVSVPLPINLNILNIPIASAIAPVLKIDNNLKKSKKIDDKPTKPRVKKILKSKIMSKTESVNEITVNNTQSPKATAKNNTFIETNIDNVINVKDVDNVVKDIPSTVAENLLTQLGSKRISDCQVIPHLVEENEPIQLENKAVVTKVTLPIVDVKLSVEKLLKSDSEDELPLAVLKSDKKPEGPEESPTKPTSDITITDLLNSSRHDTKEEEINIESLNRSSNNNLESKVLKRSLKKRNKVGVNMRPLFKIKAFKKPLRKPSIDDIMATIERVIKNSVDEAEEEKSISSAEENDLPDENEDILEPEVASNINSESAPVIDAKTLDKEKENIPDKSGDTSFDNKRSQKIEDVPIEPTVETEIVENRLTEVVSNIPQFELKVSPKRSKKNKRDSIATKTAKTPASKKRTSKKKNPTVDNSGSDVSIEIKTADNSSCDVSLDVKTTDNSSSDVSIEMKTVPVNVETEPTSTVLASPEFLAVPKDVEIYEKHQVTCDTAEETHEINIPDTLPPKSDTINNEIKDRNVVETLEVQIPIDQASTVKESKQNRRKKSASVADVPKLEQNPENTTDAFKLSEDLGVPLDKDVNQSETESFDVTDNKTSIALEEKRPTKPRRKCTLSSRSPAGQTKTENKNESSKVTYKAKANCELLNTDSDITEPANTTVTSSFVSDLFSADENKTISDVPIYKELIKDTLLISKEVEPKTRLSKKRMSSQANIYDHSNMDTKDIGDKKSAVETLPTSFADVEKIAENTEGTALNRYKTRSLGKNRSDLGIQVADVVVDTPKQNLPSDPVKKMKSVKPHEPMRHISMHDTGPSELNSTSADLVVNIQNIDILPESTPKVDSVEDFDKTESKMLTSNKIKTNLSIKIPESIDHTFNSDAGQSIEILEKPVKQPKKRTLDKVVNDLRANTTLIDFPKVDPITNDAAGKPTEGTHVTEQRSKDQSENRSPEKSQANLDTKKALDFADNTTEIVNVEDISMAANVIFTNDEGIGQENQRHVKHRSKTRTPGMAEADTSESSPDIVADNSVNVDFSSDTALRPTAVIRKTKKSVRRKSKKRTVPRIQITSCTKDLDVVDGVLDVDAVADASEVIDFADTHEITPVDDIYERDILPEKTVITAEAIEDIGTFAKHSSKETKTQKIEASLSSEGLDVMADISKADMSAGTSELEASEANMLADTTSAVEMLQDEEKLTASQSPKMTLAQIDDDLGMTTDDVVIDTPEKHIIMESSKTEISAADDISSLPIEVGQKINKSVKRRSKKKRPRSLKSTPATKTLYVVADVSEENIVVDKLHTSAEVVPDAERAMTQKSNKSVKHQSRKRTLKKSSSDGSINDSCGTIDSSEGDTVDNSRVDALTQPIIPVEVVHDTEKSVKRNSGKKRDKVQNDINMKASDVTDRCEKDIEADISDILENKIPFSTETNEDTPKFRKRQSRKRTPHKVQDDVINTVNKDTPGTSEVDALVSEVSEIIQEDEKCINEASNNDSEINVLVALTDTSEKVITDTDNIDVSDDKASAKRSKKFKKSRKTSHKLKPVIKTLDIAVGDPDKTISTDTPKIDIIEDKTTANTIQDPDKSKKTESRKTTIDKVHTDSRSNALDTVVDMYKAEAADSSVVNMAANTTSSELVLNTEKPIKFQSKKTTNYMVESVSDKKASDVGGDATDMNFASVISQANASTETEDAIKYNEKPTRSRSKKRTLPNDADVKSSDVETNTKVNVVADASMDAFAESTSQSQEIVQNIGESLKLHSKRTAPEIVTSVSDIISVEKVDLDNSSRINTLNEATVKETRKRGKSKSKKRPSHKGQAPFVSVEMSTLIDVDVISDSSKVETLVDTTPKPGDLEENTDKPGKLKYNKKISDVEKQIAIKASGTGEIDTVVVSHVNMATSGDNEQPAISSTEQSLEKSNLPVKVKSLATNQETVIVENPEILEMAETPLLIDCTEKTAEINKRKSKRLTPKKKVSLINKVLEDSEAKSLGVTDDTTKSENVERSSDSFAGGLNPDDADKPTETKSRRRMPVRRLIDEISSAVDVSSGNRKIQADKTANKEVVEEENKPRPSRQANKKQTLLEITGEDNHDKVECFDLSSEGTTDCHVLNLEENIEMAVKNRPKRRTTQLNTLCQSEPQTGDIDNDNDDIGKTKSRKSTSLLESSLGESIDDVTCNLSPVLCEIVNVEEEEAGTEISIKTRAKTRSLEQKSILPEKETIDMVPQILDSPNDMSEGEEAFKIAEMGITPKRTRSKVTSDMNVSSKVDSEVAESTSNTSILLDQTPELSKEVPSDADKNMLTDDCSAIDRPGFESFIIDNEEGRTQTLQQDLKVAVSPKKVKTNKKAKKKKGTNLQTKKGQVQNTEGPVQTNAEIKSGTASLKTDEIISAPSDKDKPAKAQKITLKPPTLNFLLPPMQFTSVFTTTPGSCFGGFSFSKPLVEPVELGKEAPKILQKLDIKFGTTNETHNSGTQISKDLTTERSNDFSIETEEKSSINVADHGSFAKQLDVLSRPEDLIQSNKSVEIIDEMRAPKIKLNLKDVLSRKSSKKKKNKKDSKIKTSTPEKSFSERSPTEATGVDLKELDISNVEPLVAGESIVNKLIEDSAVVLLEDLEKPEPSERIISKSRRKDSSRSREDENWTSETDVSKKSTRSKRDLNIVTDEATLSLESEEAHISNITVEKTDEVPEDALQILSSTSETTPFQEASDIVSGNILNITSSEPAIEAGEKPNKIVDVATDHVDIIDLTSEVLDDAENILESTPKLQSASRKVRTKKSGKRSASTKKSKTTRTPSLDTLTKLIYDSIEKLGEGKVGNSNDVDEAQTRVKRSKSSSSIPEGKTNEKDSVRKISSTDDAFKPKSPKRKSRKPTKSTVLSEEIIYVSKQSEATVSYSKSEEKLPVSSGIEVDNKPSKPSPAFRDEFALLAELSGENLEDLDEIHNSELPIQKSDDKCTDVEEFQEKHDLSSDKKAKEKKKEKSSRKDRSVKAIDESHYKNAETVAESPVPVIERPEPTSKINEIKPDVIAQVKRKFKPASQDQMKASVLDSFTEKTAIGNEIDKTGVVADSVYVFSDEDVGLSAKKHKKNKKSSKEAMKKSPESTLEVAVPGGKEFTSSKVSNDCVDTTMRIKLKKSHNKKLSLVIKPNEDHTRRFGETIEQVNYVSSTVIENEPLSPPKICLKITKDPIHNLVTVESNIKEVPPKQTAPRTDTRFELSPPKLILKNLDQKYLDHVEHDSKLTASKLKSSLHNTKRHPPKHQISDASSENNELLSNEMSLNTTVKQTKKTWALASFMSEPSTDETSEADTIVFFTKPKIKRKTKTQLIKRSAQKKGDKIDLDGERNSDTGPDLCLEDKRALDSETSHMEVDKLIPTLVPECSEPEQEPSSTDEASETDNKSDLSRQRSNRRAKIIANSILQRETSIDKQPCDLNSDRLQPLKVLVASESHPEKKTAEDTKAVFPEPKKSKCESEMSTDETSESDSGVFVKPKPKKKIKHKTSKRNSLGRNQSSVDISSIDESSNDLSLEAVVETTVSEIMSIKAVPQETSSKNNVLLVSDVSTDESSGTELKTGYMKQSCKRRTKTSTKKKSQKTVLEPEKITSIENLNDMINAESMIKDLAKDNTMSQHLALEKHTECVTTKPKVLIAEAKLVVPDTCMKEPSESVASMQFSQKIMGKIKNAIADDSQNINLGHVETDNNSEIDSKQTQNSLQTLTPIENSVLIQETEATREESENHEFDELSMNLLSTSRKKKQSEGIASNQVDVTKSLNPFEEITDIDLLGILTSRRRSSRVLQKDISSTNDRSKPPQIEGIGDNESADAISGSRSKRKSKIAAEQRLQQLKAAENLPLEEEDEEIEEEPKRSRSQSQEKVLRDAESKTLESFNDNEGTKAKLSANSLELSANLTEEQPLTDEVGVYREGFGKTSPENISNRSLTKKVAIAIKKSNSSNDFFTILDGTENIVTEERRKFEDSLISSTVSVETFTLKKDATTTSKESVLQSDLSTFTDDIVHPSSTAKITATVPESITSNNDVTQSTTAVDLNSYTAPFHVSTETLSLAEKVALAIRESNKKLFDQTSPEIEIAENVNDEPNKIDEAQENKILVSVKKPDNLDTSQILSDQVEEEITSRSKRKSKLAANKRLQELSYSDNDDLDECFDKSEPVSHVSIKDCKADKKHAVKQKSRVSELNLPKELTVGSDEINSTEGGIPFNSSADYSIPTDLKDISSTLEHLSSQENLENIYKEVPKMVDKTRASSKSLKKSRSLDSLAELPDLHTDDVTFDEEHDKIYSEFEYEQSIFEGGLERSASAENLTQQLIEDEIHEVFIKPKMKRKAALALSKRTSKKIDLDKNSLNYSLNKQIRDTSASALNITVEGNIEAGQSDFAEIEDIKKRTKSKTKNSKSRKHGLDGSTNLDASSGRKTNRKAKSKALEHILDEALSELSASNQNSDLLLRKKSESDCLPFEPEENLIRLEKMANNNIEMSSVGVEIKTGIETDKLQSIDLQESIHFGVLQQNKVTAFDDLALVNDIPVPNVGCNDMLTDLLDGKPCLRPRNQLQSTTTDKVDAEENIDVNQEVRRSRRATRKVGTYNENEIDNVLLKEPVEEPSRSKKKESETVEYPEPDAKLEPVPMVLEDIPRSGIIIENPPRISNMQLKESFSNRSNLQEGAKIQSKLNSDELFDLLKKSTNDNPEFQKPHNYVPNFDEISDFSSDSNNFDNVFEDILEIEDNLDESGKETRSDTLDTEIFQFPRDSGYRIDGSSEAPLESNDVSIPSIDISKEKETSDDFVVLNDTEKMCVTDIDVAHDAEKTSVITSVTPKEISEKVISESKREESDNANSSFISTDFSESSTDKFNPKSKKSSKKSRGSRSLTNLFCDICNKSFRRSDNLVKHKRTLTHISKLSELEAQEAMNKPPEVMENQQSEDKNESNISIVSNELPEDIAPEDVVENPKSGGDENINISNILIAEKPTLPIADSSLITTSFAVDTESRSLKLADIINDVLNKPVLERSNGNNFSDIILQNSSDKQPEYRRYKSLGERKSFESDAAETVAPKLSIDPPSFLEISDNTERVEKQITLLQNIIEKNGTSLNYAEEISASSNQSMLDSARVSPSLSIGSSRQDDSNNITFCGSNKMGTNDDSFIKPSHYEEISEDSAQHRSYEEQKARKVLNRDEELFLECCSLWKSGSEVSNYSKKSHKLSLANSREMKAADGPEWMEHKQLAQKRVYEDNYSDNSRIPTPLGDSYNDEMSNSNTISSNWNANRKEEIEANNRAMLQRDVGQVEEDRSFVFPEDSGSAKSEENTSRFGAVSKAFEIISEKVVDTFESRSEQEKPIPPDSGTENATEETIENDLNLHDSKKFVTKGAKKEFEGLKVSIPTEELNLSEVLNNCSPTAKVLDNKVDKTEPVEEQKKEESQAQQDFATPHVTAPKILKKGKFSKARLQRGSKFGFKMKKKMPIKSVKRKRQTVTKKNDNSKSVDVYDFEETQDNSDIFTKPDFRSFRCKKTEDATKTKDTNGDSDNDSRTSAGFEGKSVSSVSSMSSIPPKKPKTQPVTKKKCMIMGRIFRNAVKSKIDEDIRDIPTIDNAEMVNNYVMNCPQISPEGKCMDQEPNEMIDNMLDTGREMPPPPSKDAGEKNKVDSKLVNKKKNTKLIKSRKRNRANSDSTDDEFSLDKASKKRTNRKNPKAEDNTINLEQELKECIGVASRKSQRKCTSGKQNVLVEYWSSDDSSFEALLETQRIIPNEDRESAREEEKPTDDVPPPDCTVETETGKVDKVTETPVVEAEESVKDPLPSSQDLPEQTKELQPAPKQQKPKKSKSTDRKLVKKPRVDGEFRKSISVESSAETLAASRRKRAAADPLYHWSSSSEDESQDLIEVKPVREELDDDEDRPIQHGWIVGDSPKKLVTMLAQAKGKKVDAECVKEQGKKRTANTNS